MGPPKPVANIITVVFLTEPCRNGTFKCSLFLLPIKKFFSVIFANINFGIRERCVCNSSMSFRMLVTLSLIGPEWRLHHKIISMKLSTFSSKLKFDYDLYFSAWKTIYTSFSLLMPASNIELVIPVPVTSGIRYVQEYSIKWPMHAKPW